MSINKIDLSFFEQEEVIVEEKHIFNYSYEIKNMLLINKHKKDDLFDYMGFKIIKTNNTNSAIKNLIYKDNIYTNIKINDYLVKQSDVIIISAFTRLNDILSSRTNGNVHNFLKEKQCITTNNRIEEFISSELNKYKSDLENIVDYDFSKCEVMNFISIKNDFVDENNIFDLLKILKTFNKKYLIIFNDISYLKYEKVVNYLQNFNFLYFINSYEFNYEIIENYQEYLINI